MDRSIYLTPVKAARENRLHTAPSAEGGGRYPPIPAAPKQGVGLERDRDWRPLIIIVPALTAASLMITLCSANVSLPKCEKLLALFKSKLLSNTRL